MTYLTNVDMHALMAPTTFTGTDIVGPIEETGVGFKVFDDHGHRFVTLIVRTPDGIAVTRLDGEYLMGFAALLKQAATDLTSGEAMVVRESIQ